MESTIKKLFILLIFLFLFSLNFISASSFGYNYLDNEQINYSLIPTVNNSQFLQGYTPTTLGNWFETTFGWISSAGNPFDQSLNITDSVVFNSMNTSIIYENNGKIGINTNEPVNTMSIYQVADSNGVKILGYGDKNTSYLQLYVNQNGAPILTTGSSAVFIQPAVSLTSDSNLRLGSSNPNYQMRYDSTSNRFEFDSSESASSSRHSIFVVDDDTYSVSFDNSVGIGTNAPDLGKVQINGSTNGFGLYVADNISADDYFYHSPFTPDDYTKEQALIDINKITGNNGEINHNSLPSFTLTEIERPIYEQEQYNVITENCVYEKEPNKQTYSADCNNITEIRTKDKTVCHTEIQYEYERVPETEGYQRIAYEVEVCIKNEPIYYEYQEETSIGRLIGIIIKSIQGLTNKNAEQDLRLERYDSCLILSNNFTEYKNCVSGIGQIR